jgi:hypothetical protein
MTRTEDEAAVLFSQINNPGDVMHIGPRRRIHLATADRLFAGMIERIRSVKSTPSFGMDIKIALLFGSYMRRAPKVGDIDIALLPVRRPNYEYRVKLLRNRRWGSHRSFVDELYAPEREVLQFVKNRCGWISLHDVDDLGRLDEAEFKVVHAEEPYRTFLDKYERRQTSRSDLFAAIEKQSHVEHRLARGDGLG